MKTLKKLVIVSQPNNNDEDVKAFNTKEKTRAKQAAQRTERYKKIASQKDNNNGLHVKSKKTHPKYHSTLACKLDQAFNN